MKRLFACVVIGAVALFWGCSDTASGPVTPPIDDGTSEIESSDSSSPKSSAGSTSSDSSKPASSTSKDTVTIVQHVKDTSGKSEELSYYSSGIFCWTEGCEKDFISSSSAESSSSDEIIIAASSASVEPPTVNGNTMVDNRDGKSYQLKNVGGKLWMAQDLAFKSGNSMCFDDNDAMCEKYGRLYAYVAATKACPPGWRLPNRNEVTTLFADDTYPWSYSGRCKDGNCDFTEKMGFHWTSATPQDGDKNFDSNKGDSYAVIIVEKEPEYAGEGADQKFFQVDSKTKFFSVRCVQE
ncbi:FISUMP domain-containing protein [Fibrobacter sp. UBA2449]|uniref:FISUMP domain-containing protein n=1 Tax=Fibrobacter sp. UBA2449 TaxID=1946529 RepID=UPI0025BD9DFF|nr:FISUMP domain-containing protein [Fibrobacter sp. UBA2449]